MRIGHDDYLGEKISEDLRRVMDEAWASSVSEDELNEIVYDISARVRGLCHIWWELVIIYQFEFKIPSNCAVFSRYVRYHNDLVDLFNGVWDMKSQYENFKNPVLKDMCQWTKIPLHFYP